MKRDDLLFALNAAKASLVGVDFIPILSHFCFTPEQVYAYDDISAVFVDFETGIEGAVKGDLLLGVLQTCGEDVELKQKGSTLEINTPNGTMKLPVLDSKEFMFKMPDMPNQREYPFTEDLRTALELCAATVGRDPRRPEFIGITIMHGKEPNSFLLYSTDNVTLSRCVVGKPKGIEQRFVLPKSTAEQALTLVKLQKGDAGDPVMVLDDTVAVFLIDARWPITVVGKLLGYKGTDFDDIIAKNAPKEGYFEMPEDVLNAVRRSIVVASKSAEKLVTLATDGKKLSLHTKSDLAEASANYTLNKSVPEATATVDAEALLRALLMVNEAAVSERGVTLRSDFYTHIISAKGD